MPPTRQTQIAGSHSGPAGASALPPPRSRRARLPRPDERTHELAVDRREVDALPRLEKHIARILRAIDAGGLEIHRLEAGLAEPGAILALLQRAGHAPDPQLDAPAN